MEIKQIEFQFKGEREYIQGPDMFNAVIGAMEKDEVRNICFTAHGFVKTPICKLFLTDDKQELAGIGEAKARCHFDKDGKTHWGALVEDADNTVAGRRYEFDEASIISACRMESEGIVLMQPTQFSFIENIVAMNKHMHLQMFPEIQGSWAFTRIDLDADCEANNNLELRFRHNMNYRLTKSDILFDGKKIGDLYFSLVKA